MRRHRTTTVLAVALIVLGGVTLAACGGDDGGGGDSGTTASTAEADVTVEALDIRFDESAYTAEAGDVEIAYVGVGEILHTLVVEDAGGTAVGEKLEVRNGEVATGTFPLDAGTYALYCDVPGHRDAGMEATLTVS